MTYGRSRKVPFNCYLSVDQLDALDAVSEREGRPRAELVREALTEYLAHLDTSDAHPQEEDSEGETRNSLEQTKTGKAGISEANDSPQGQKRRRTEQ